MERLGRYWYHQSRLGLVIAMQRVCLRCGQRVRVGVVDGALCPGWRGFAVWIWTLENMLALPQSRFALRKEPAARCCPCLVRPSSLACSLLLKQTSSNHVGYQLMFCR